MLFPEIILRSSSASNQTPFPELNSQIYLSGTKQNFHRYLNSSNSQKESDFLRYQANKDLQKYDAKSPSSFHDGKINSSKKILLKNSEKNFPKDFFENIKNFSARKKSSVNFYQKSETNEQDISIFPQYLPKRNSQIHRNRYSEIETNISYEKFLNEKYKEPNNHKNLGLFKNGNLSKMAEISVRENYSFPQKFVMDSSLKNFEGDIQNSHTKNLNRIHSDATFINSKLTEKYPTNIVNFHSANKNFKINSKPHLLKPLVQEKSQSTQENSKILTDNENEFIESIEINDMKSNENDNNINVAQSQSGEEKNNKNSKDWGAIFTFYDKNFKEKCEEKNEELSEKEEENYNRKTGNFYVSKKKL